LVSQNIFFKEKMRGSLKSPGVTVQLPQTGQIKFSLLWLLAVDYIGLRTTEKYCRGAGNRIPSTGQLKPNLYFKVNDLHLANLQCQVGTKA
jgi:hypothetical protein